MKWFLIAILSQLILSICVLPVFAQSQQQLTVNDPQSGKPYSANYVLTGATITNSSINDNDTSLLMNLNSSSDGNLTITLPRTLIDAKFEGGDDQFVVLVDGSDQDFVEHPTTSTDRTITVSFPAGTNEIEIVGSQVVPEFGEMSFVVLVIAILSIIVISVKTRLNLGY
jgi:predicted secreted protein with PEFG-CTERM motif